MDPGTYSALEVKAGTYTAPTLTLATSSTVIGPINAWAGAGEAPPCQIVASRCCKSTIDST